MGIQALIEHSARSYLAAGGAIDFSTPPGEPALAGPDSVSWQVFRNPVGLFVGGVAAVILELAEPRVREGVWTHSSFRDQPAERLRRTGMAAMVTVYGARSVAERMTAGIAQVHAGVSGTTPLGASYRASDPELLTWVHATAAFGFLSAFTTLVQPLGPDRCDAFYAEGVPAGRLYGVPAPPASQAEAQACLAAMRTRLEPSPILFEFLDIMRTAPILPPGARLLQNMLVRAAVSLLPVWARERLRLDAHWSLRGREARLLRTAARLAQRLRLDSSPASQACVRLGLPPDHLQAVWAGRPRQNSAR
jgi:uncharacterized protein (DUF2236 family)